MSNICWFRLLKCEDLQVFSAKIKQSLGFGLLAGQNKPFLRCHFRLWEVVTRIFWYKYTKYCIYNHTHTHQTRLCVIVVIWDGDISPLTKHLHHLPVLQRADSKNRLIKRKKKKRKGVMFFDCESKGQPLTAMQMSSCVSVKWPFVFSVWSVPSLLWNCPMSHPLQTHGVKNTPAA